MMKKFFVIVVSVTLLITGFAVFAPPASARTDTDQLDYYSTYYQVYTSKKWTKYSKTCCDDINVAVTETKLPEGDYLRLRVYNKDGSLRFIGKWTYIFKSYGNGKGKQVMWQDLKVGESFRLETPLRDYKVSVIVAY